eukprot:GDKI01039170.1.p1 GENE.GDKI01039170.1~~GDKI01039170.1.p1  ORF type:complete len:322 (-),score=96.02 GDKI01039170.1:269-1234(-)
MTILYTCVARPDGILADYSELPWDITLAVRKMLPNIPAKEKSSFIHEPENNSSSISSSSAIAAAAGPGGDGPRLSFQSANYPSVPAPQPMRPYFFKGRSTSVDLLKAPLSSASTAEGPQSVGADLETGGNVAGSGTLVFDILRDTGLIFLCVSSSKERGDTFAHLNMVRSSALAKASIAKLLTAKEGTLQSTLGSELASLQMSYNAAFCDQLTRVRARVQEINAVMLENIDKVLQRGERIELLVDKSAELSTQALVFNRRATSLAWNQRWRLWKLRVTLFLACMLVLYVILAWSCGGWNLAPKCINWSHSEKTDTHPDDNQ